MKSNLLSFLCKSNPYLSNETGAIRVWDEKNQTWHEIQNKANSEIDTETGTKDIDYREHLKEEVVIKETLIYFILESLDGILAHKGTWFFFFVFLIFPSVFYSIDERKGWMPIIIASVLGICCIIGYAVYRGIQVWRYEIEKDSRKQWTRKGIDNFDYRKRYRLEAK